MKTKSTSIPPQSELPKKLAWVIVFKALFLGLIWYVCFSTPPVKHMTDQVFVNHILAKSSTKGAA